MNSHMDNFHLNMIKVIRNDFAVHVTPESSLEKGTFSAVCPGSFLCLYLVKIKNCYQNPLAVCLKLLQCFTVSSLRVTALFSQSPQGPAVCQVED